MKSREREIIYFALSRLLDDKKLSQKLLDSKKKLSQKEFDEIDNLRNRFKN